jgi:hypothetical protein
LENVGGIVEPLNTGSELTLHDVTVSDSGMYTCTAVNSNGSAGTSAYVRVTVRTQIVKPVPAKTMAVDGTDIVLPCGVESDEFFKVTWSWYHNETLLLGASHVSMEQDGSLRLHSVSRADVGTYTCKVESDGGHDSSSGWLDIIEKPSSPWLFSASLSHEPRSVSVVWMSEVISGISWFTVYGQPTSDSFYVPVQPVVSRLTVGKVESSGSLMLTVINLQPGISYRFTVTAENAAGEGLPSAPSNVVTIPEERPSGTPTNVVVCLKLQFDSHCMLALARSDTLERSAAWIFHSLSSCDPARQSGINDQLDRPCRCRR